MVVKSGICQGNYETRLCGKSQAEVNALLAGLGGGGPLGSQKEVDALMDGQVDELMAGLGTATTELHPNNNGTCNMSYVLENSRCRCVSLQL